MGLSTSLGPAWSALCPIVCELEGTPEAVCLVFACLPSDPLCTPFSAWLYVTRGLTTGYVQSHKYLCQLVPDWIDKERKLERVRVKMGIFPTLLCLKWLETSASSLWSSSRQTDTWWPWAPPGDSASNSFCPSSRRVVPALLISKLPQYLVSKPPKPVCNQSPKLNSFCV